MSFTKKTSMFLVLALAVAASAWGKGAEEAGWA